MQRTIRRIAPTVLLVAAILMVSGCGQDLTIDLQPEGGDYDQDAIQALVEQVDAGDAADVLTEEAAAEREEVLIDLRTQGDDASDVANLLMRGFPEETAALPISVEGATFDGVDVWVIVEAWGDAGGTLDHRRAWVFDRENGDLLYSMSRR